MSAPASHHVVALVGHCSPDSSFLTMAVQRALPGTRVNRVHSDAEVEKAIASGALLLINRRMEPGYADHDGNAYIRRLREKYPQARMMLISNFADSQAEAESSGALPGFGKNDLMRPIAAERLRAALGVTAAV